MLSLFRPNRIIYTSKSVDEVLAKMKGVNRHYVSKTKYLEVLSRGTRTLSLYFDKSVAYAQIRYSISKEVWVSESEAGTKVLIKTRPIIYAWAFPILLFTMLPDAISNFGIGGSLIVLSPLLVLELLFLFKSTTENKKLDALIDMCVR